MVNYIKSEVYRSIRNSGLWISSIFCLAVMVGIILILGANKSDPTFPYATTTYAFSVVFAQMDMMMVMAMAFSLVYYGSEDKDHTLKHTVAYGINRDVIYIGRLLVQSVICLIIYTVICAVYILLGYAMLRNSNMGELFYFIRVSLGSLTSFFWALAVAQLFQFLFKNTLAAAGGSLVVAIFIPIICNLLGQRVSLIGVIAKWMPYNLISNGGPMFNEAYGVWKAVIGGAVWLVAFLIIGCRMFRKMEVK